MFAPFKAGNAGYVLASLSGGYAQAVCSWISGGVRITIPAVAEGLKDSDGLVRSATIELLWVCVRVTLL